MSDLNKWVGIGRLTSDPTIKHTKNGTAVCNFSIANTKTYVADGEKKEQTSFFNCEAWAKTGEVISEYCKKGQRIGIDGRLKQERWQDENGNNRSSVTIVVDNFQFLSDSKKEIYTENDPFVDE